MLTLNVWPFKKKLCTDSRLCVSQPEWWTSSWKESAIRVSCAISFWEQSIHRSRIQHRMCFISVLVCKYLRTKSHFMQGQACLWLGRWFQEVGGELDKAKKCLEEALVIDPKNREIAQTLRQVNQGMGRTSEADALEHLTTLTETSQKSEQTSAFANASLPAFSKQPSGEWLLESVFIHSAAQASLFIALINRPSCVCAYEPFAALLRYALSSVHLGEHTSQQCLNQLIANTKKCERRSEKTWSFETVKPMNQALHQCELVGVNLVSFQHWYIYSSKHCHCLASHHTDLCVWELSDPVRTKWISDDCFQ